MIKIREEISANEFYSRNHRLSIFTYLERDRKESINHSALIRDRIRVLLQRSVILIANQDPSTAH